MEYPSPEKPLNGLLNGIAQQLDITNEEAAAATALYDALGEWLVEHGPGAPDVYPQGSFRLGTVVRPPVLQEEYDIDLVFWREIQKTSTTQAELRETAGELLRSFCASAGLEAPEELGRCWRIRSSDGSFHIDILPVIPDDDHASETAVLLSDRDLREWQYSNPIEYADWFYEAMGPLFEDRHIELASAMNWSVEEVPRWFVRTPLQRTVQLMKRHRDLFFLGRDDAPVSILITTLAAMAYEGQASVETALSAVLNGMADAVEAREGEWWVPNPTHEGENFADKWNSHLGRREAFLEWLDQLQQMVAGPAVGDGIHGLTRTLGSHFGPQVVRAAATEFGTAIAGGAAGALRVGGLGAVGTAGSGPTNKPHTFHGP